MVTQNKVLMLLAVILIGTSYGTQVMPNTYTWYNVRSVVQQYNNYPAIVINDTGLMNIKTIVLYFEVRRTMI